MIKINRTKEPDSLKKVKKILLSKYLKTGNFDYSYGNQSKQLRKELNRLTDNHCAYCDILLLPYSKPQIDHFKPKKKYKLLAYSWINLFPTCGICNNNKQENLIDLRPDAKKYNFKDNFYCKNTGELAAKNKNAQQIINLLDLNSEERVELRWQIYCDEYKFNDKSKQVYRYINIKK